MEVEVSGRDLIILGMFEPDKGLEYREIVNLCLPDFHPTPHELVCLRRQGLLTRKPPRSKWFITDAGIQHVEIVGGG